MMFAAVVGHCFGRATPSLRNAPPWQSREIVRGENHLSGAKRCSDQPDHLYPFTSRMIFVLRSTIGSTRSLFSGANIGTARATPISANRFRRSTSA